MAEAVVEVGGAAVVEYVGEVKGESVVEGDGVVKGLGWVVVGTSCARLWARGWWY